jgi:heavy metal translocating P-type ATPase
MTDHRAAEEREKMATTTDNEMGGESKRTEVVRLSVVAVVALTSWLGPVLLTGRSPPPPVLDAFAVAAALIGGYPVYVETFKALLRRQVNMEVSMTIAIFASLAVEQFTAAVVVTFFVLLSEFIEGYAVEKGRATIVKLESSLPRMAVVRRDGVLVETDVKTILPDEAVVVKDGERIPVDGLILRGVGAVDQASITGESLPVDKTPGDHVYAGTIDLSGILEIRTESVGRDTVFGKIIKLVEDAENRKAPIQKLSDTLAARLVEFTIVFAAITFLVTRDLISTLSVIIVAGACGVAAGTPLAIVATMGYLAKRGVIVKGGVHIQQMREVDTVVIDKTGTLTFGEPTVKEVFASDGYSQGQVIAYAAAAERLSNHPLARAIVRAGAGELANSSSHSPLIDAGEVEGGRPEYSVGKGIVVSLSEGEQVMVGNALLMAERGVEQPPPADKKAREMESRGLSAVLVAHRGMVCGVIGISDRVRTESRRAVEDLARLGISTVMLTGDNQVVARLVGDEVGIADVRSGMLPQDKVATVERLVADGRKVAMVGDGINDAPALARAEVGIGMGGGTDVAIEEADIVLMTNDLERVPETVVACRRAFRTIMTNFYGTLLVDGIGITLAFFGLLNPLLAAGIHVISELVFILNAARLIR